VFSEAQRRERLAWLSSASLRGVDPEPPFDVGGNLVRDQTRSERSIDGFTKGQMAPSWLERSGATPAPCCLFSAPATTAHGEQGP